MRWLATLCIASVVLFGGSAADAKTRRSVNDKGTMKQCSSKEGKRKCKRVAVFQGHNANKSTLRTEPLAKSTSIT